MTDRTIARPTFLAAVLVAVTCALPVSGQDRWSVEKARAWHAAQPWPVGANFIPSSAINQLEMWQADTFDPKTIDRELGYAQALGMNTMRVYLHNLPWEEDAPGFQKRIGEYLAIADKRGIKTIFVLFDSCWNDKPTSGKQPEPKPGVHNSGWVRAPGTERLFDARKWAGLEAFVKGVVGAFKDDRRVLAWDVFNEPSNSGYMDAAMPLLQAAFDWARAAAPSQPITAGLWHDHPKSNDLMLARSDVITFHDYDPPDKLEAQITRLAAQGRPMICTEYMARTRDCTFESCLPVLKKHKVGAINWGLVKGKTNTVYAWDAPRPDGSEPPVWFHDIFRPDGTPFSAKETAFLRAILAPGR